MNTATPPATKRVGKCKACGFTIVLTKDCPYCALFASVGG